VILGQGKSAEQIAEITERIAASGQNVLVTRVDAAQGAALGRLLPTMRYQAAARLAVQEVTPVVVSGKGTILVVTAGTSDHAVAEEAAWTAELSGNKVERLYD